MKRKEWLLIAIVCVVLAAGGFGYAAWWQKQQVVWQGPLTEQSTEGIEEKERGDEASQGEAEDEESSEEVADLAAWVNLDVPYVNEAPDDVWTGSWKNACEEATIVMVEAFYNGQDVVTIVDAKRRLQSLFDYQQAEWGSDANSDVARTNEVITATQTFRGTIVQDPTVDQIKDELRAGRPVIAFHHGFDLQNKNIPFLPTGSSYHTTVIKGFDDTRGVFITNDPGDRKQGQDHVYAYSLFMSSLHDYSYTSKRADGPARVLFTSR